ncbi:Retrovirus-related Pol polyprotein from transposon TNT 1-94 [Melia azedarach]|uniref:Retrovirus-related Pol polyprotein from transposon TNT 1-94 n=1 Tax=Melia azedarach TaxID=155640 RepID=A0ACC1XL94_MELAZ|nr:Retrovirus-related Pol polyprotein from transposon TNT 1-94 [Melia azedarach]
MATSSNSNATTLNPSSTTQPNTSFVFAAPIKLAHSNYLLWKTQVLPSIRANGLEDFIDENQQIPRSMLVSIDQEQNVVTNINPEYLLWQKQDQMLMSWLLSSMSEGVLGIVLECKTSLDLWSALQKYFMAQTTARTMQLRSEIHNTKKESMPMNEYYLKMKSLVEDLRCAGNHVTDGELILFLMEGLGSEYDPVVVNITSRPEKIPLQEVYSMLISHERRVEKNQSSASINFGTNVTANYVQHRYNNFNNKNWSRRTNQNQHAGNLENNWKEKHMGEDGNKPICQICFKPGHEAYRCWNRFNKKFVPRTGSRNNLKQAYVANPETTIDPAWYLDSGASNHVTNNLANLSIGSEFKGEEQLVVGNGCLLNITHIGYASLPTAHIQDIKHLHLKDILHVPAITKNLISVSKLISDNNINIIFDKHLCLIKDKLQGKTLLQGVAKDGLYQLVCCPSSLTTSSLSFFSTQKDRSPLKNPKSMFSFCSYNSEYTGKLDVDEDWNVWHRRLGHPHFLSLEKSLSNCTHYNINRKSVLSFCKACQFGKLHKLTFKSTETRSSIPLEIIHSDLWGPAPILSNQGYRYYIAFIDDKTNFTWIYPMKTKGEALNIFKQFKTQVETMLDKKIKAFQCDMGGEFKTFEPYLKQTGITLRYSCPYTHHQNGKAERKHRHIVETGLTLLAQASMPLKFWWEAFNTATFLINRISTPVLRNISPFEALFHTKPDFSMIKTFGCECYPFLRPYNKHKLNFHTSKCVLLGLSVFHKGYLCLHHSGRIYIARHVVFNENSFPFENDPNFRKNQCLVNPESPNQPSQFHVVKPKSVNSIVNVDTAVDITNLGTQEAEVENLQNLDEETQSTRSLHHQYQPNTTSSNFESPETPTPQQTQSLLPTHPMITRAKAGIFKPKIYSSIVRKHPETEVPKDVQTALSSPEWSQAMTDEFTALKENQTWTLVPYTSDMRLVGNKWVYKVKMNPDGTISRFKARLVAKGYLQTAGVDYNETFSPVVKASTIRIVVSLAVINNWALRQVDVNNAFLNGELTETVYMTQPEGFIDLTKPNHVCKLKKALYGLKQAPRAWFEKLKNALKQWGFENSKCDTSLFFKRIGRDLVIILVYVDDIVVTGSNNGEIERIICQMNKIFALKDLGQLHYFLGIEVNRTKSKLVLSQSRYISELLNRVNMSGCKGTNTPLALGERLSKTEGFGFQDETLYRSVIGALQYATLTRPELAYAVNKLSQFMAKPLVPHWTACKRVLRYLKDTKDYGLEFTTSNNNDLVGFCDADWGCDVDDRKSISGYCIFLGGNLVSWSSKKQHVVARSSAESEYRAIALTCAEITWISSLLSELNMAIPSAPVIWSDSISAAAIASNPVLHGRTKHIEIDLHFIRDKVSAGEIEIQYISSQEQTADILTKPLSFGKFSHFRNKLKDLSRQDYIGWIPEALPYIS